MTWYNAPEKWIRGFRAMSVLYQRTITLSIPSYRGLTPSSASWIADLCAQEGIPFVLGHALYMKAIHGGKAKNDKIDAHKIAVLLRGGMIPMAYVYPREMRSTRDLLRRRMHLTRKRAELLAHIQNTNYQYNLPDLEKKIARKANRVGVAERFPDESVRKSIELDLKLLDYYDQLLPHLEHEISLIAKIHDPDSYFRIRSFPGHR
jgi:transposase